PANSRRYPAGITDPGYNGTRPASLLCPHNHRGDIRRIHGRVEKLGAGQLRKMHELVAHFLHFAADLLAGFHPQLDHLADVLLENTDDGIARLQIDLALREKATAGEQEQEGDEK